ncbi:MAG: LOG family protein [Candidatus Yanofskybacteria bacterium]|nr:LOG family protein [Candidatus Yanofskybacteria bacterium]
MKYKFVISGAAEIGHCAVGADKKAYELGQEIVKHNGILITGATSGIPNFAAKGAKEAGGISIGISPAASYAAHVKSYKLPTEYYDFIIYTGFDYSGRNLLLTRSSDAVIVCCGRIGTLNEFTIAFEDNKPIGVLEGSGGTADEIKHIIDVGHRGKGKIIYDSDPKRLVEKLIELIGKEYKGVEKRTASKEESEFAQGRE